METTLCSATYASLVQYVTNLLVMFDHLGGLSLLPIARPSYATNKRNPPTVYLIDICALLIFCYQTGFLDFMSTSVGGTLAATDPAVIPTPTQSAGGVVVFIDVIQGLDVSAAQETGEPLQVSVVNVSITVKRISCA